MNRKTALLSYLVLVIIFITLDSAHARIKSPPSNDFEEEWTENEIVTLNKLSKKSILVINRTGSPTLMELRNRKNSYTEMFTLVPAYKVIQIKNNYGEMSFDLLYNAGLLRNRQHPKRLLRFTVPDGDFAFLKNERGELVAYYDSSTILCEAQSPKVRINPQYMYLTTEKHNIEYDRETNVVKISDEINNITIDIAKRSIEGNIGGKRFTATQTWHSNNHMISFQNNGFLVIKYGVYDLTLSLPGKRRKLFLRSPHANLTETQTNVILNCEAGSAEMTLKNDETVEEMTLTSIFGQEEGSRIVLRNYQSIIYGSEHLLTIEKRSKASSLSFTTKLAQLKVLTKK